MNITVIGATGTAGAAITSEALTRGHRVRALSRNVAAAPPQAGLTHVPFDILTDDPAVALANADIVVLSVRFPAGDEHRIAPVTARLLDAARTTTARVLIIGGAAPLRSPHNDELLVADDPAFVPPAWRAVAHASLEQFRVCEQHPFERWTYLSPPAILAPGRENGRYRRGTTQLLVDSAGESRIAASELAIAALDELESPASERHITVVRRD